MAISKILKTARQIGLENADHVADAASAAAKKTVNTASKESIEMTNESLRRAGREVPPTVNNGKNRTQTEIKQELKGKRYPGQTDRQIDINQRLGIDRQKVDIPQALMEQEINIKSGADARRRINEARKQRRSSSTRTSTADPVSANEPLYPKVRMFKNVKANDAINVRARDSVHGQAVTLSARLPRGTAGRNDIGLEGSTTGPKVRTDGNVTGAGEELKTLRAQEAAAQASSTAAAVASGGTTAGTAGGATGEAIRDGLNTAGEVIGEGWQGAKDMYNEYAKKHVDTALTWMNENRAATVGIYAGVTVGARVLGGGSLTRDGDGRSDIVGIPFL